MEVSIENKDYKGYYIASIFMFIFILNDLIFDYLFNFTGSDLVSFVFTLATSIIVFIWNRKLKASRLAGDFEKISKFIKSNFDNWQVIFSFLDIICGIISLIAGLSMFACIFKALKIFYIPAKIISVTNKEKTIITTISKGSLMWTVGRIITKTNKYKGENFSMKKLLENIKNNPKTIFYGFISGGIFGYSAFSLIEKYIPTIPNLYKYLIIGVISILAFLGCCWIGWDKMGQYALRTAHKTLSATHYNELLITLDNLNTLQQAENKVISDETKLAKQKKLEEKKALALAKKQQKKQEEEEKNARIQKLVEDIKAKRIEQNSTENNSNENNSNING